MNKLQWKFNRNSNIHENAIESVVCEMAAILSRPQCVNLNDNDKTVLDATQLQQHSTKSFLN